MKLSTAITLSRPALLVALYWEAHGAAPVGTLAQAIGYQERATRGALAELREAGIAPLQNSAHDHGPHGHGEKEPGTDSPADLHPLAGELVQHGIWEGAAVKLVATHGEERVRVQLAYHQARLDGGFPFRSAPAAHLYRAIAESYAPWAPPAPGNKRHENDPATVRKVPTPTAVNETPRPTWDEAKAASARGLAACRAAMGR